MSDEAVTAIIVDASVAAKFYFDEEGSVEARRALTSGASLLAPDLLFIEMASVASQRVRRKLSEVGDAARAVSAVRTLVDRDFASKQLVDRAFQIASDHAISAYDATYLALAEKTGAPILTADVRLVRRAGEAGWGDHVRPLLP